MKKYLLFLFPLLLLAVSVPSCATIMKGGTGDLYMVGAPDDLVVEEDGELRLLERLENKGEYSFGDAFKDEMNSTKTTYYSWGIKLQNPGKERTLTLRSISTGKTKEVKIETRFRMLWFWTNLFTTGGIGMLVDELTGNWYEFAGEGDDMFYLNVAKHLNGL